MRVVEKVCSIHNVAAVIFHDLYSHDEFTDYIAIQIDGYLTSADIYISI